MVKARAELPPPCGREQLPAPPHSLAAAVPASAVRSAARSARPCLRVEVTAGFAWVLSCPGHRPGRWRPVRRAGRAWVTYICLGDSLEPRPPLACW